ncbi:major facilitator superfamily domain-containing protein [Coprinopsis sp. MPI-PUGE-AT-0042]|nr:major facilitator superfamily domain-containing protein [Coprinopsis sp. MPI-PUGE-AT-0042]
MVSVTTAGMEQTPLLAQATQHEAIYDRFSLPRKRVILTLVSICALMPLFISGTFIPCIPQIAKDLGTTGATVSLAVSISVFGTSIGALIGSSYSSYYGRRIVYLCLLPICVVGCVGVASALTVPQLLFWRFLQAFGVSGGLAVGAAVLGDIYKLEERGSAMGVFFAAAFLGPALAPLAGGFAAHYGSWRHMQIIIGVAVAVVYAAVLASFPETSHPGTTGKEKSETPHPRWRPVALNFFSALWVLRNPALLFVAIASFLAVAVEFSLLIPIAYTIGERYGIKNEALIGACFIPDGLGSMIGAPIGGRMSDRIVAKWKAKRGSWYPEDRLRAAIPGAVLVPLSVFLAGICTKYVDGPVGLATNLCCLFLNGFGVDMALTPYSSYVVDVMHSRSAESVAAQSAFRAMALSVFIATIIPTIDAYGVLVANTMSAAYGLIGLGLLLLTVRHGEWLRAQVDVGFSNENTN